MTRVLLCRHGRTDWNDAGRYQGRADVPLNAQGREESQVLAASLRDERLDAVYASALSRAYATAEAVAMPHGLVVVRDARLNEINQGEWEGLLTGEIQERYPDLVQRWRSTPLDVRMPGGETVHEVRDRALAALRDAVQLVPEGAVAVVTHRVTMLAMLWALSGADLATDRRDFPANCAAVRLDVTEESIARALDGVPASLVAE